MKQSTSWRIASVGGLLIVGSIVLAVFLGPSSGTNDNVSAQGALGSGPLFCFWNVENLFDDQVDKFPNEPDRSFDLYFAKDAMALERKLELLCRVLLHKDLSKGLGPDILALAEVESYRATELLAKALNSRLKDPKLHYQALVWKDVGGGRGIATGLIARVPLLKEKTRIHGKRQRILEVHLNVGGEELVVFPTHWSSRISDKTGNGRKNYADTIYSRYKSLVKINPKAKVIVCGDFNDDPTDESVKNHLYGTGDREAVLADKGGPKLLNLLIPAHKRGEGTHFYRTTAHVFDQILVVCWPARGQGNCLPIWGPR